MTKKKTTLLSIGLSLVMLTNVHAMPISSKRPTASLLRIQGIEKEISEPKWDIEHIQKRIKSVPTPTPQPTSAPTPKPIPQYQTVVSIAKQYLGTPYVWGGTTPKGFDCSGLVQYVYKQIGINISRTTYTQVNDGAEVLKNNLRPGDLVFFAKGGDVHHVGIYIGNGQFIHSPQSGDVVKVTNLSERSDYYTARRIVK